MIRIADLAVATSWLEGIVGPARMSDRMSW